MRILLGAAILATATLGHATVLYDGASGVLPDHASWGWSYGATGGSASAGSGVATLDTTGHIGFSAGWGRVNPFALDASTGFRVTFDLRVEAEDHSSPTADKNGDGLADRAGFSVIVLGSDQKGVELGFWNDEVWAQQDSPLFVHSPTAERATWATGAMTSYELTMVGSTYTLKANGGQILTGARKDYTAFAGFPDPYETPNFLFFGDNTTSASGRAAIRSIGATPVPEPGTIALFTMGLAGMHRRRNRARGKG